MKMNEAVPFPTAWMDLEGTALSEISRSEKDKYHVISLRGESDEQRKRTNETETDSQLQRAE